MKKMIFFTGRSLIDYGESSFFRFESNAISGLKKFIQSGYNLILLCENDLVDRLKRHSLNLRAIEHLLSGENIHITTILNEVNFEKEWMEKFDAFKKIDSQESFIILTSEEEWLEKIEKTLKINKIFFPKIDEEGGDWLNLVDEILSRDRIAVIERKTKETDIRIEVNLDGRGAGRISTGLHFFDHMLDNFAKHSQMDLTIEVKGDLKVDEHHTIEDTAIGLAEAFKKSWSDKRGIARYGFLLPMDESECQCSLDLSGRGHLEWSADFKREYVGDFPTELLKHFYYSLCINAGINMNMKITGENEHHMIESSFKCFAKCMKQALRKGGGMDLPSTKGVL